MKQLSCLRLLFAVAWLASAMPALAFYKCQLQGRTIYSDTPCAPIARAVTPSNGNMPNAADRQAAQRRAVAEAQAADAAVQARRRETALAYREQEQQLARQIAHERNCQRLAYRAKVAREAAQAASPKARAAADRKQQRSEEEWLMACA